MPKVIIREGKRYMFKPLYGFDRIRKILNLLFRNNKNHKEFEYLGCLNSEGKVGVLVSGLTIDSIRPFTMFYTIKEIEDFIR